MLVGRAFQCTHDSSWKEAILAVIGWSRYSSVCQKVDEFRLSAVRYEVFSKRNNGINYVIVYTMTRRLSMRL